jgi:hypothetical protein
MVRILRRAWFQGGGDPRDRAVGGGSVASAPDGVEDAIGVVDGIAQPQHDHLAG